MRYPVDPHFPVRDEDAPLKADLAEQKVKPIFIMGLHRSGTTFLYDSVARAFPLAQLTLYDFFYYDRLLRNHQQGGAKQDAQRLNACFAALGIKDRNIDSVPVCAEENAGRVQARLHEIRPSQAPLLSADNAGDTLTNRDLLFGRSNVASR